MENREKDLKKMILTFDTGHVESISCAIHCLKHLDILP